MIGMSLTNAESVTQQTIVMSTVQAHDEWRIGSAMTLQRYLNIQSNKDHSLDI